ncbi:hypothetical protein L195_g009770 [Trifolium pratense]|uniref:Uncharacterized protein n=1 Tax=Trifolium pratense TaxID=57577 RepID=A0A2K3PCX4_TRIPR|nr:hypothetical protein L195_g009770 [Trifolium pratense]
MHLCVDGNEDNYGLVTLRTYQGHLCFERLSIVGDCFRTKGTRKTRHGESNRLIGSFGVRQIEFIEEAGIDPWEIDGVNISLIFNGLVNMATGYGVSLVRETLEQPVPLERLYLSLHQMFATPQQPLVPQNEVPVVVPDEVVEDDNGMNFMSEEEDPEEDPYLHWEEGEFRPNDHL